MFRSLQRSKLDFQLAEEIKYYEKELSKRAALKTMVEVTNLDNNLTTLAQGKSLRSGKRLPDLLQTGFPGGAEAFAEDENAMDNISISDSEEDDGFNHWSSNEGRYLNFTLSFVPAWTISSSQDHLLNCTFFSRSYISSSDVSDWTMEAAINITSLGRKSTRRCVNY